MENVSQSHLGTLSGNVDDGRGQPRQRPQHVRHSQLLQVVLEVAAALVLEHAGDQQLGRGLGESESERSMTAGGVLAGPSEKKS